MLHLCLNSNTWINSQDAYSPSRFKLFQQTIATTQNGRLLAEKKYLHTLIDWEELTQIRFEQDSF